MQSSFFRTAALIIFTGIVACGAFVASTMWFGSWYRGWTSEYFPISNGFCNIAVIPIQGDIVAFDGNSIAPTDPASQSYVTTSGDWVDRYLRDAMADPNIFGILVQIDSYGGLGAPSAQIMRALQRSTIPTAAYIREVGTSGAYLAATGADTIIASPFASVGSIGITYSYVDNVEKNEREGLRFVQLSSGPFKDSGNPNKPLSEAEYELYQRDIALYRDLFVGFVAENRGLSASTTHALADGSVMPASLALEHGLIDIVGDEEAARAWFAGHYGLAPEGIVFCN